MKNSLMTILSLNKTEKSLKIIVLEEGHHTRSNIITKKLIQRDRRQKLFSLSKNIKSTKKSNDHTDIEPEYQEDIKSNCLENFIHTFSFKGDSFCDELYITI